LLKICVQRWRKKTAKKFKGRFALEVGLGVDASLALFSAGAASKCPAVALLGSWVLFVETVPPAGAPNCESQTTQLPNWDEELQLAYTAAWETGGEWPSTQLDAKLD